jgi:hypothetical protein
MNYLVECNCFLILKDLESLGLNIEQEGTPVRFTFDLRRVESIREVMKGEEPAIDECLVYFRSGNNIIVDLGYEVMRKKLFDLTVI